MFSLWFGSGKSYIPEVEENIQKFSEANKELSALGLLDRIILDKETVQNVKDVINAIDPDKIKAVMNAFQVDKDGWLRIKIDLAIKK